jgi:DNA-binding transcriptional MerR regulator
MARNHSLWTLDELAARVALALAVDYGGQRNGRVREVPDPRTIRYYTTLGLLDRPAAMQGRTALYGRRHLLQLVAIKRLQANGLALTEVQQRLLGLGEAALERIARVPEGKEAEGGAAPQTVASANHAFWKAPPAPVPSELNRAEAPATLQGIALREGVTLLLSGGRPVAPDEVEAIRAAAAPLLKLLEKRRLLGPGQERENV